MIQETSLEGKNIFVTGGSRDIGELITHHLIENGANAGTCYFHGSQTRKLEDRFRWLPLRHSIDSTYRPVQHYSFIMADLTKNEDREEIFYYFKRVFDNHLDSLVLNASGASYELNVTANNALVDQFLEYRKERLKNGEDLTEASLILLQSVPGHFYDRLNPLNKIPEFYRPIARAKYLGEQSLRKRIGEFNDLGIKFFVVCPPAVVDTLNWIQFEKRKDPEIAIKHKVITDSLGLPEKVTKDDVGKKVAELLLNPPSEQGHVGFFNGTLDAKNALSPVYGPTLRLPDTYNIEQKCAWMIVTKKHCKDHFGILPGFLLEEAAAQAALLIFFQDSLHDELPILDERLVTGLRKMGRTIPGDILKFSVEDFEIPRKRELSAKIQVTNLSRDNSSVVSIKAISYPRRFLK